MIKESELFQSNPFQFRLYPGSLSSIKKGAVAPVLMVEVKRENVLSGLDFFCKSFDGENPLSPCGIPFLFLMLYQNKQSHLERSSKIQDINIHISKIDIVHLDGFCNIDTLVTLRQNVTIKLRKPLLALCVNQSSSRLFFK